MTHDRLRAAFRTDSSRRVQAEHCCRGRVRIGIVLAALLVFTGCRTVGPLDFSDLTSQMPPPDVTIKLVDPLTEAPIGEHGPVSSAPGQYAWLAGTSIARGRREYALATTALAMHLAAAQTDESAQVTLALLLEACGDADRARAVYLANSQLLRYPRAQRGWQRASLAHAQSEAPIVLESGFAFTAQEFSDLCRRIERTGGSIDELRWVGTWLFAPPDELETRLEYARIAQTSPTRSEIALPSELLASLLGGGSAHDSGAPIPDHASTLANDPTARLRALSDAMSRTGISVDVSFETPKDTPLQLRYCLLSGEDDAPARSVPWERGAEVTMAPGLYRIWAERAGEPAGRGARVHVVAPGMDLPVVLESALGGRD